MTTNPVDRWSEGPTGWLLLDDRRVAFGTNADAVRELIAGYPQQDPTLPEGVERLRDGRLIASGGVCRTLGGEWEVLNGIGIWLEPPERAWSMYAYFQVRRKETTELVPWHEAWGRTLPNGEVVRVVSHNGIGRYVNGSPRYVDQDTGMVEVRK